MAHAARLVRVRPGRRELPSIDAPVGGPVVDGVDVNQSGAFRPDMFRAYFAGNKFGAMAIQGRAEGVETKSLAREHRIMCDAMLDAWSQVKPTR